jgi:hypothetical protein
MSQQLQITGGAKVRALEGVITGTSGVLGSLPINASNGIPQLDVNGKILVSQLPNSVMEYQGTWNVVTNTPYLVNGVGNPGDVYIVTNAAVGGTNHNFGAGNILFYNGDQTIYDGSAWQRASGSSGTVTSVAVTPGSGVSALSISGSPITTSGTITIDFAGTNSQYVTGSGGLTTFPSLTGYIPYIGATSSIDLNNQSVVNISHLGINTTTVPTILLRAVGDNNSGSRIAMRGYSSNANSSSIRVTKFRGTAGAPQAPLSGDSLGKFELAGYGTTSSDGYPQASFEGLATENWGATARGTKTVIKITPNTTTTQAIALTINQDKSAVFENSVTGTSFIKTGGTSSQFLKADGSVDSSSYIILSSLSATSPIFYNSTTGVISSQAASDTLAGYVTTGNQTFAGRKTFNDLTSFNQVVYGTDIAVSSGFHIAKGTSFGTLGSTYVAIEAASSTGVFSLVLIDGSTSTFTSKLSFPNTANFVYTFPSTTGTIALISNLSSYQPLATNLTSLSGLTYASTSFVKMTASGTFSLDTNTYALASALSSYLPLTGGTLTGNLIYNPGDAVDWYIRGAGNGPLIRLKYNIGGTNRSGALGWMDNVGTFTDILSWTNASASFNTNVSVGGNIITTGAGYFVTSTSLAMQLNGSVANDLQLNGGGPFRVVNQAYNVALLNITNAGVATFSSTITATSLIKSGGTSSQFLKADGSVDSTTYGTGTVTGTGTINYHAKFTATGVNIGDSIMSSDTTRVSIAGGNEPLKASGTEPYIGIYSTGSTNTAGLAIYPSTGYDAAIGNYRGGSLNLIANSTKIAQINATGYNLDVTGAGRFSGALTVSNLTSNIYIQSSSNPSQLLLKGTNSEFWVDSKYGGGTARAFINRESNGNQATLMFTTGIAITNGTAWGGTGVDWSMGMANEISNNFYIAYGDLYSSANRAITITSSKYVGIGTSSPITPLSLILNTSNSQISTGSLEIQSYAVNNSWIGDNIYFNGTAFKARNAGYASQVYFNTDGSIDFNTSSTVFTAGQTVTLREGMRINNAGNVLINQQTAAYVLSNRGILEVNGSDSIVAVNVSGAAAGYFYANPSDTFIANNRTTGRLVAMNNTNGMYLAVNGVSWIPVSSDIRKKKNFEITQGLNTILQIEPVKYHFLTDDDNSTKRLGFKAQNIQPLIPEMVLETGEFAEDGSPFLTITPDYILPVLVKAIQEQQAQIEELKQQVQSLLNK